MSGSFSTSNETFRKLMGNGVTYRIPSFQRDYSWAEEHWDDLWEDIQAILEAPDNEQHYMGYLVLQSSDNRRYTVIDGQQRLTTISLIFLAAIANLNKISPQLDKEEAKNNQLRAERIRSIFIGDLDSVTLVTTPKLTLNRHNNDYYQIHIMPLQPLPKRGLRASEKQLRKAFDYFYSKIGNETQQDSETIAKLVDKIADKLLFTVITVKDELNAYKVFETLNARGVRLSSTDLLKNYLFSLANNDNQTELDSMEKLWETTVTNLGEQNFPDFLRVYWNSRYSFSRQSELYKKIRNQILDKEQAFAFVRESISIADIYATLKNPADGSWNTTNKRQLTLLKNFSIKQPIVLLLACFEKFGEGDVFSSILKSVVTISFRYNIICGLNPNEQERVYIKVAQEVIDESLTTKQQILNRLESIYPSDELFKTAFTDKEFDISNGRGKKILRYILFELEKQLSNEAHDIENDSITIEHICPINPEDDDWADATHKQVHRIGNTTLLNINQNKEIANKIFADKSNVYTHSSFQLTRSIPEHYKTWDEYKINSRQAQLAKIATAIWSIQYN